MRSRAVPHKTVIFRLSSLGDILLTTPVIRALRTALGPDACIDFVVKKQFSEIVRYNPHLSQIIEFDAENGESSVLGLGSVLRKKRYDVVFDLHNSLRTRLLRILTTPLRSEVVTKYIFRRWMLVRWKRRSGRPFPHAVDRYFETLHPYGIHADDRGLEIAVPDDVTAKMTGVVAAHFSGSGLIVALCPGARHFTKRWPWDKYAETAELLLQNGTAGIVLLGGVEDKELCDRIASVLPSEAVLNLAGSSSILESAAALDFCDVVLTNDSGLMHLAAARHRPVVALFGSTTQELGFAPYGTRSRVIEQEGLSCRPCSHIGMDHCPEKHFRCMLEIQPENVTQEIQRIVNDQEK